MKDQYFGDVNDFRKYGLLRALIAETRLAMFVCWMLTPPDGSADGQFTEYLSQPALWEKFDPPLHRFLRETVLVKGTRGVGAIEESGLLPSCRFHGAYVPDGRTERHKWSTRALEAARGTDIAFFDPDNGMEVMSRPCGRRGSSKYLLWDEARRFYSANHSILIYQHYPRVRRDIFLEGLARRLLGATRAPLALAFRTSRLAFLLLPQELQAEPLRKAAGRVGEQWRGQIEVSEIC